ncbi:MAG: response regulator [Burkholderiales bacterium]|nr:response regulator [Burkholderiales bacterium]
MPPNQPFMIADADVYIPTFKGSNELQASETGLPAAALKLLVLIDGRSTVAEIRDQAKTFATGELFLQAMRELLRGGYVDLASNQLTQSFDFIEFFREAPKRPPDSALEQLQSEVASGLTTLQQNGYYVRIAMRPAESSGSKGGESVLIVEDDASLARFLRKYLELEGFVAATASNRDEIIAGLRRQPPPDLVLLDVMLPDADGFNILLKMREHPVLKSVPVLMLTAKATRESVLKGLAGGANGYITKPFQPDSLITAVKTVLGVSKNPFDHQGRVE